MLEILNKPYPRREGPGFWLIVNLISGLLVSLILLFILSFQTENILDQELITNISSFGLVTIVCMSTVNLLLPFIFKNYFKESMWTLGKNILWSAILLLTIALGNTLLANIIYNAGFSLQSFGKSLYYTIGVGLIINTFFSLLHYRFLLKQNTDAALLLNRELAETEIEPDTVQGKFAPDNIVVSSENEKENFTFHLEELLFIESVDNYSRFFLFKDNKLSDTIIRSSLKRVETLAAHPELFRCHRSYLVNLRNIGSVSGNAQGYQLHVKSSKHIIPVSRNAGKELHKKLQSLKL